ncbi:MAG: sensor histidine kinase [Chloroflexi bacterium]|nr:sensor histidine kinase [Chloroflexota bacterium]
MALVIWLHYFIAPDELLGLFTSLAFLPTVYGALWYGWRGGLGAALVAGIALSPHFLLHHAGPERLAEVGEIAVIVISGGLIGWQVDRVRRQQEREREAKQRLERYARGIVVAQEEERRRIARELHDDTVQGLVSVGRSLESLERDSPDYLAEGIREVRRRSQALLDSLRRFSRDLRPSVVDDLGLVPALEGLAQRLSARLPTEFLVEGSPRRLSPEKEVALFRIVQEALTNAEKHARASQAKITVTFMEGWVHLVVADNGRGFVLPGQLNGLANGGRLGLLGMRERAELIGGSFSIASHPGAGTTIAVQIEA